MDNRQREDLLGLAIEIEDEDAICFLLLPKFGPTAFDPDFPKFRLDNLTDEQCCSNFRFNKQVDMYSFILILCKLSVG